VQPDSSSQQDVTVDRPPLHIESAREISAITADYPGFFSQVGDIASDTMAKIVNETFPTAQAAPAEWATQSDGLNVTFPSGTKFQISDSIAASRGSEPAVAASVVAMANARSDAAPLLNLGSTQGPQETSVSQDSHSANSVRQPTGSVAKASGGGSFQVTGSDASSLQGGGSSSHPSVITPAGLSADPIAQVRATQIRQLRNELVTAGNPQVSLAKHSDDLVRLSLDVIYNDHTYGPPHPTDTWNLNILRQEQH
jgi:hypothetical protein